MLTEDQKLLLHQIWVGNTLKIICTYLFIQWLFSGSHLKRCSCRMMQTNPQKCNSCASKDLCKILIVDETLTQDESFNYPSIVTVPKWSESIFRKVLYHILYKWKWNEQTFLIAPRVQKLCTINELCTSSWSHMSKPKPTKKPEIELLMTIFITSLSTGILMTASE